MPRSRPLIALVAAAVTISALAACTATAPMPVPTTTQSATPSGDGVLRIGTLFPTTGAQSYLGQGQAAGVEAAVREINQAGGVLGKPVEVFQRDSGDATTDTLEKSFADLQTKPIDVIIGPSSSVLEERLLPKVVAAGIPLISPAATSVRLSSLNDAGYLFRTIPSAALQGAALGATIGGGKAKVAIVYLDDDTGNAVLGTLTASLKKSGGTLVAAQKYVADTKDFGRVIDAVKKATPDAVVFVSPFSAMEQNKVVITQLSAAGFGGAKLWLTSDNMADYSQALPAGTLTGVNGILEGADPDDVFRAKVKAADPAVANFLYSAEAYDATVLAALAATVAHDDGGLSIKSRLRDVSEGGIKCTSYGECLDVLTTRSDIDYDGISGPIGFDRRGDPSPAHYGIYKYDAGNRFARVSGVVGG